jgi:hypothetical protein
LIFVSGVVIAWAFYELLKGVDRELALLGALLRIADAAILTTATLCGVVASRLVSGAEYLEAIDSKELAGLARPASTQSLYGFSLHPNGKRFLTTVSKSRSTSG